MAGKQADIKVGVVTSYDDKGIRQAETGLSGFKKSIGEAEGAGNKLKAGFANVKEQVVANAGALAVGAGAALVAFGVKAVGAFTDTAKAAKDLGDATGLSTEEASRWIAVGDDMEVSAEALTTAFGKVSKSLDSGKWEQYGIATRDAGGKARDVNDILLDSFDALGKIQNETERAKAGNELFGKGYKELAPLIGKSRKEMEAYLGAVEKGQVVTDAEAEKAERFRLAQDALNDALQEVTLSVGEQVAGLAPLIEVMAKLIALQDSLPNPLKLVSGALDDASRAYDAFTGKNVEAHEELIGTTVAMAAAAAGAKELESANSSETRAIGKNVAALASQGAQVETTTNLVDDLTRHLDEASAAYDALTGRLDEQDAWQAAQEAIFAFNTDTEKTAQDVRDATRALADYTEQMSFIPAEKKTEIFALLNAGDLERAEALLANLARNREASIFITTRGGAGYDGGINGARASGGPVSPNGAYLVGENGPEVLQMGAKGGNIIPNSGGGMNVTVQVQTMPTGPQLVALLKTYDKQNATNIVTPVGR
jgi:hypothetical protein